HRPALDTDASSLPAQFVRRHVQHEVLETNSARGRRSHHGKPSILLCTVLSTCSDNSLQSQEMFSVSSQSLHSHRASMRQSCSRKSKRKFAGMERSFKREILEGSGIPEEAVSLSYRELTIIHRLLGNTRYLIHALRSDSLPVRRVLDIGCGRGGVLQ